MKLKLSSVLLLTLLVLNVAPIYSAKAKKSKLAKGVEILDKGSEEFEKQIDAYFDSDSKFCWKDSYGRGVGTIPGCGNKDRDAGLCYDHCDSGYKGVWPVCWGECDGGKTDVGLTCWGSKTIWFVSVPCCPDIKRSYGRGVGKIPSNCGGDDKNVGLCYKKCRDGYYGVGPVCWRECGGDTSTDCGAACASSTSACVSNIFNMVKSVLIMIYNIVELVGTGGTSGVTRTSAKAAKWGASLKVATKFKAEKLAKHTFIKFMKKKGLKIGAQVSEAALGVVYDNSDKPIDTALNALSVFDPTGIVDVIIAFKHDVC